MGQQPPEHGLPPAGVKLWSGEVWVLHNTGNNLMCDVLEDVRRAEEQLRVAMLRSDVPVLETLLAEDLIFTNHLGQRLDRNSDLAAHKSGTLSLSSIELSNQEILLRGAGMAVVSVSAQIDGEYAGEPACGVFAFTRVWVNESGNWQVVAAHSSCKSE